MVAHACTVTRAYGFNGAFVIDDELRRELLECTPTACGFGKSLRKYWNLCSVLGVYLSVGISLEVVFKPMVIIAVFGGLVVGGALFAILKNNGSKASEDKYTKLDIG